MSDEHDSEVHVATMAEEDQELAAIRDSIARGDLELVTSSYSSDGQRVVILCSPTISVPDLKQTLAVVAVGLEEAT